MEADNVPAASRAFPSDLRCLSRRPNFSWTSARTGWTSTAEDQPGARRIVEPVEPRRAVRRGTGEALHVEPPGDARGPLHRLGGERAAASGSLVASGASVRDRAIDAAVSTRVAVWNRARASAQAAR